MDGAGLMFSREKAAQYIATAYGQAQRRKDLAKCCSELKEEDYGES